MKQEQVLTGWEELIGADGEVRVAARSRGPDLRPGRLWRARLADEEEQVPVGDRVRVATVDGLTLVVSRPRVESRSMGVAIAILAVLVLLLLILVAASVRILREYERGVIFRLGRLIAQKGPGLIILIPFIDQMVRVDLRTVTLNVPPQEVITRDNVTVQVNAVAYFRVIDPNKAIIEVENFLLATSQIAQTTLRSCSARPSSTSCSPSASGSTPSSSRSSTSRPSPGA